MGFDRFTLTDATLVVANIWPARLQILRRLCRFMIRIFLKTSSLQVDRRSQVHTYYQGKLLKLGFVEQLIEAVFVIIWYRLANKFFL